MLIEAARGADLFICECYMYETPRKSHMTLAVLRPHFPRSVRSGSSSRI